MFQTIKYVIAISIFSCSLLFSQSATESFRNALMEGNFDEAAKFIPQASDENKKSWEFQLQCGDIFLELENYDQALVYFKKAYERDDDEVEILTRLGRVYSIKSDSVNAFKYLNVALNEEPKSVPALMEYAKALIRANNQKEAQIYIARAQKLDSKNPQIYLTLGDMYFSQGIYELAKNNYLSALEINPEFQLAKENLATSYYWLANREPDNDLANELFSKSLDQWGSILRDNPNNSKAYYEQGKIFFMAKRYVESSKSLLNFARLRPDGVLGRWLLSQSLYEIGQCDSAAPHLEYVSKNLDSVSVKAQLMLAECYYNQKNYDKAVVEFENVSKLTTLTMSNERMWATSKLYTADTVGALQLYKKIVDGYPEENCSVMDLVGRLMIGAKQYDQAIYFLNKRIGTSKCSDSTDSKIYYFLGLSYLFDKQYEPAKEILYKTLALDSTNLNAQNYLADAYANLGEKELALDMYNKAIETAKVDTSANKQVILQAFSKICGMMLDAKKTKDLIKYGKAWSDQQSDISFGFLYTAIGYHMEGDQANACSWYKKTLKVDPNNGVAKDNLGKLGC